MGQVMPILRCERVAFEDQIINMGYSSDESLLTTWGWGKQLRRGLLVTILSLLISAVIFLFFDSNRKQKDYQDKLEKQNQELLKILIPSINKVNNTVNAVDT